MSEELAHRIVALYEAPKAFCSVCSNTGCREFVLYDENNMHFAIFWLCPTCLKQVRRELCQLLEPDVCPVCAGTGHIAFEITPWKANVEPCPECKGADLREAANEAIE